MKPGRWIALGVLIVTFGASADLALALSDSPGGTAAELPWAERYRAALEIDPDNASLRYQLGLALLAAGDNPEAVAELHRAYPALSQTIGINFNLGLAYTRLREPDSALLFLEQAEAGGALEQQEIYPLTSALYNVALLYLDQGAPAPAIDLLRHVVALAPDRRDLRRLFGEVLFRAERIPEAQEQLSRYLELYPDDAEVREILFALHFNRAQQGLEAGHADEARKAFERALEVVPDSPTANYYLASIDYRQQHPGRVVTRLAGMLATFPEDIQRSSYPLLYNASRQLFEQGALAMAGQGMAPLVALREPALIHLALAGRIDLKRGDFASARDCYARLLALDPAYPEARGNLAVAEQGLARELVGRGQQLYRDGDAPGAYRLFVKARALTPRDRKLLASLQEATHQLEQDAARQFGLAEQLAAEGDALTALTHVRQGLALWPEAPQGGELERRLLDDLELELARQLLEAQSLLALGELPRAVEAFALLLETDPGNEAARNGLGQARAEIEARLDRLLADGQAALENGELDAAAKAFEAVLRERPEYAEALEGMQRIDALRAALLEDELQWARRAFGEGDFAAAREHFQNLLRQYDTPPLRNEYLVFEAAVEKRLAGLLIAARQARAEHDYRTALEHYREACRASVDPDALRAEFEETLREADETMLSLLVQAREALEAGEAGQGVRLMRAVLRIEPSQAQALQMLAASRDAASAEAAGLLERGRALEAQGEVRQAREAYVAALAVDPYLEGARRARDTLDLKYRQGTDAQVERVYLEGVALYTRGHYRQAIEHWQQVLGFDAGHAKAKRNLAKAKLKLHQLAESRS